MDLQGVTAQGLDVEFPHKPSPLLLVYTADWLHKDRSSSLIPLTSSRAEALLQLQVAMATALASKMDMQVPERKPSPTKKGKALQRESIGPFRSLSPCLFFCMFLGQGI